MQFFQLTTLVAVAATVSAVAIPDTDHWKTSSPAEWGTPTTPWGGDKPTSSPWGGDKPTTSKWGGDKPTSTPWGGDKPTTSKWGGDKPTSTPWGGDKPTTSKWGGDKPTSTPWGGDKPTSTPWGGDKPTTTSKWGGDQPWGTSTAPAKPTGTGTATCCTDGHWSYEPASECTANGGEPYQCTTIGLLNLLNCISLLNGNTVTIPITLDIL